ncbi:hypothetical protein EGW08_011965, partial [Elysia chlorotica]
YLLIFDPAFADNDILYSCAASEFLLVNGVMFVDLLTLVLRKMIQGILVHHPSSFFSNSHLSLRFLKLSKGSQELLTDIILSEKLNASFINGSSTVYVTILFFKPRIFDPVFYLWMHKHNKDISLVDGPCSVKLLVPQLEVDVGVPGLLLGLPFHPAFKHLT